MASLLSRDLYCPRCRKLNYLAAKFCDQCGAALAISGENAATIEAEKKDELIGCTTKDAIA
jgi:hypothetical protein